jgi:hypothetical protein
MISFKWRFKNNEFRVMKLEHCRIVSAILTESNLSCVEYRVELLRIYHFTPRFHFSTCLYYHKVNNDWNHYNTVFVIYKGRGLISARLKLGPLHASIA